ncbi:bifunctional [glutamate--ammonia ligase]-adenylyl-L-tyrosine phosphorylase/[glutamate--ammonia-ligase] adenylyltransferase [Thiocapsa bogorovii]|uniref:bifunctional [glutamate--ammonia ligase]-adenylyl-L-tyrosine phosphorylase/[glutamate--ammonia-ligase] adenylyltransferase n=1 Tax=Thiocapsa bogorovii TaxID=521689 RepID=UPI001E61D5AC|nr:bifunctional [glutamate--ammonia ligase]-adenylyl-L-tyrosine phosphorylase/[glutamate--ammonia-ligase] adenylyltransferase [Thiocapsa bogorovii]UHD18388.1 bifunctional [glutamate--ammonia ligase]-adenylyl-L-tyrosine phosphorylase/[glutamate--ammonia-ligase] adenylyltransferase [Thiocapsa bogorovii]
MDPFRNLDPATEAQWQTWLDWAAQQGVDVPGAPDFADARARVWEASDYVAISVARHPEVLADLIASGELEQAHDSASLARGFEAALAPVTDEPGLHQALRRFRRREMIRIIWRDIAGRADLAETLEHLTALADLCIQGALDRLYNWTRAELGTPRDEAGRALQMTVLGMGKLGARELNLSSDIDLIFAFAANGETEGGPRTLANEQFFTKLGQRLAQSLGSQTVDGFVFRVDTRLRPFGESGPLAMSFNALEDYYQTQAREWERYAMIKARVVAGDPDDARELMAMLRPFVYRRYLDFGAIESLRDLKRMIAKELYRRGMEANIKLGPGGIREIEFIGQAFQLIRGGHDADLQIRPIREVLALLAHKQLMPESAVQGLDDAYCFLRLVENRIQAYRDKQTHLLPADEPGRLRLARSMGFDEWPAFETVLEAHRRHVQGQFDEVFAAPETEAVSHDPGLIALWHGEGDAADEVSALAEAGFAEPEAIQSRLIQFRDSIARKGLSRRGHERLERLVPMVLRETAASEQPDFALERVLKVLEAVARRTSYLAMLSEHPVILAQLARLASMSPWFTDRISRHPLLLDEMIDTRRLYAPLRRVDLEAELDALLLYVDADDLEQQMERLRQFAQGNMLRVAAADLTEVIPLMVVSDYLTEIAEVSIRRVLRLAFDHLAQRHGHPTEIIGEATGFLVLGYGKLGGIELGYGSDLDLVFVHGTESQTAMTDGAKEISNEQFFARLGQRIIHILTTQTPSGVLYEIDMRLRPEGNRGLLVRSLAAFDAYQSNDAWTWEHQALIRARPVAGDPQLAQRFGVLRRTIICREREPEQLRNDVREMRAKMRANLDKSRDGRFDLKQGPGGIADIEFMVQYAVLRWASEHPALADWTDNIRLLETLGRLDLLPGRAAEDLTAAYKALRAAYHRSALQEQPKTVADTDLLPERERVQSLWHALMDAPAS